MWPPSFDCGGHGRVQDRFVRYPCLMQSIASLDAVLRRWGRSRHADLAESFRKRCALAGAILATHLEPSPVSYVAGAILASHLEPSWEPSWPHTWSHLTMGATVASHLELSWPRTWSHLGARVWRAGSMGETLRNRTHVLPRDMHAYASWLNPKTRVYKFQIHLDCRQAT